MEQDDDDDGDRPEGIDVSTMTAFQWRPPRVVFKTDEMRRHEWQQQETVMASSDPSDDAGQAVAWPRPGMVKVSRSPSCANA
ncbi:hypothetical protein SSBR45G_68140 [Bradyrhizobium sp. SSBR45G]|nr:hypothetical protein SSBR45G_68140 [Bradyrhizobium sp. SSBR45G]GLH89384.1 hypothetical protein SSBR45R_68450 [Bradyrhizobium sp. SSBR45R]